MAKLTFYTVDVFAERKYEGNQLAVVRNAASLSDQLMQRIAKEFNYSETTFILAEEPGEAGYPVRIFTPDEELPFAGHPTLGTAFIIQQEILGKQVESLSLSLKVGSIPVEFRRSGEGTVLWMTQVPPTFGDSIEIERLAAVLNLSATDFDDRFPIQEVSTGIPFILVPLKSLASVKKARIARDPYFELVEQTAAKAIFVFAPETYHAENDLNVRLFADYFGIAEDPATGSANGCLAGYLAKHRFWGEPSIEARSEQGYEIGRPSLLLLRATDEGESIRVEVGGRVAMVVRGELI